MHTHTNRVYGCPDCGLEVAAPEVATAALDYMHSQGEPPWAVSTGELARALGVGQSTAVRALRRLVREGRLTVRQRGRSRNYPSVYGPGD
jgi:DNA-binding IclR family transcriptional regulator